MSRRPETRYATGPDGHVAYFVAGHDEAPALVFMPEWYRQLEAMWEDPSFATALERLASFSCFVCFDPRGVGLSDPMPLGATPTVEHWVDDVGVVMDAAGIEHAALVACSGSGPQAIGFAASHPERVSALVLFHTYARHRRAPDFPIGTPDKVVDAAITRMHDEWGTGAMVDVLAPTRRDDERFRRWFGSIQRLALSPGSAAEIQRMLFDIDVRDALETIQAPTLVVQRTGNAFVRPDHGRYLAARIPGARLVELDGADHIFYAGDVDAVVDEIEAFLTGVRRGPEPDRVLTTMLFTDIVSSTDRAAALGDRAWRELLDRHHGAVRRTLERFHGVEIDTAGDGFFATFDSPTAAIRCVCAIRDSVRDLGLELRQGVHTGEVEQRDGSPGGIAVHVASRVAALAQPGEVLVTRTVKDLVAGSGLAFGDMGEHSLKGVPDEWRLYLVA